MFLDLERGVLEEFVYGGSLGRLSSAELCFLFQDEVCDVTDDALSRLTESAFLPKKEALALWAKENPGLAKLHRERWNAKRKRSRAELRSPKVELTPEEKTERRRIQLREAKKRYKEKRRAALRVDSEVAGSTPSNNRSGKAK